VLGCSILSPSGCASRDPQGGTAIETLDKFFLSY